MRAKSTFLPPVIPWPYSKTSSQAKAAHTERPGALCSEEKYIVGFLYSFLRSNDHNCHIGMSTGSLPFSLSEMLLESRVQTWSHVLLWGLTVVTGMTQETNGENSLKLCKRKKRVEICYIRAPFSSAQQNQRFLFCLIVLFYFLHKVSYASAWLKKKWEEDLNEI